MTAAIELEASTALLNEIYQEFATGTPHPAVRRACETFRLLRSQMTTLEWAEFRQRGVSQHPVRDLLRLHLPLLDTFRNGRRQILQELNAIRQEKQSPAIQAVEGVPVCATAQCFDFVYSAGLFDTLETELATEVLAQLVGMLRPHGRLLVTNVGPATPEAAYLEACWNTIPQYRSEEEMAALTALVPEKQIFSQCVYRDEEGGVVFLEIQRAAH